MSTFFLVYKNNNRNQVVALFRAAVDAHAYAQPNGWAVEEARVTTPIIALPEVSVVPE